MTHVPNLAYATPIVDVHELHDQGKACGGCGAIAAHPMLSIPGDCSPDNRDLFSYFTCGTCDTLQIAAVPDDLAQYYGQAYYSMRDRQAGGGVRNLLMGLRNAYAARGRSLLGALLYRFWPHPQLLSLRPAFDGTLSHRRNKRVRILDVGCGAGSMLHDLRLGGFGDLTGIDPFLSQPVDEPGFRLIRGELTNHRGTYDVIMFNHSLEHVTDPLTTLIAAQGLLAPDGVIIVRVPLVDSEAWRIYGDEWGQLDAPRHLFLFSRRGLAHLAQMAGCEVVHAQDDSDETQFVLSELRLRGVRFHEIDVKSMTATLFTPAELANYKRRAAAFNRAGRGDQAAFYLKERIAA